MSSPLPLRVLIGAVCKKTTDPQLHFFNNCFDDEFSTRKSHALAFMC